MSSIRYKIVQSIDINDLIGMVEESQVNDSTNRFKDAQNSGLYPFDKAILLKRNLVSIDSKNQFYKDAYKILIEDMQLTHIYIIKT